MERRLVLLVGKKSYPIVTSLEEEEVQRAASLVRSLVDSLDSSLSQDERLFLASMTLSSQLLRVQRDLEGLVEEDLE
ncbi:MAG: cell division protein ZapA [Thermanaerothrix sp.]|nr:cell division protein ZapA [Thermanaerothrix sp.]